MGEPHAPIDAAPRRPLLEVALFFLRLGFTSFGGPAAHVALMQHELVEKRRWVSAQEFLDLVSAANLIPGPNSTELAIHLGHRRAGRAGLVVAGACFILPATLMVILIAWGYTRYRALPEVGALLAGIKPVMLAIVVQALWGLRSAAMKSRLFAALFAAALALGLAGVNEIALLLGGGAIGAAAARRGPPPADAKAADEVERDASKALAFPVLATAATSAAPFSVKALFLFFLKVGSILYGSGYVLLAFLRADLVERWRWLTEPELLDAIAVGQVTPGPVFTTATFIGFVLGGLPGAIAATVGIFLPAFVFVALTAPIVPKLRSSTVLGGFLDGANAASLALMAAVTITLGREALRSPAAVLLAIAAAAVLLRYRINATWLVLAGGIAGLAIAASKG